MNFSFISKKLIERVFPGEEEVFTSFCLFRSRFMRLDFPTFERPANAISGMPVLGHPPLSKALVIKFADTIFKLTILSNIWSRRAEMEEAVSAKKKELP